MTAATARSTAPARPVKIATIVASDFPAAATVTRRALLLTGRSSHPRRPRHRHHPALRAPARVSTLASSLPTASATTAARGPPTRRAVLVRTATIAARAQTATSDRGRTGHRTRDLATHARILFSSLCPTTFLSEVPRLVSHVAQPAPHGVLHVLVHVLHVRFVADVDAASRPPGLRYLPQHLHLRLGRRLR